MIDFTRGWQLCVSGSIPWEPKVHMNSSLSLANAFATKNELTMAAVSDFLQL